MKFYIGIYQNSQMAWVSESFMLSYQVIRRLKRAWSIPDRLNWVMDSGGFSELRLRGKYTFAPEEYIKKVEQWQPDFFMNMDYMCEPNQIKKTGKTVEVHQKLTIDNQIRLQNLLEDSWINKHTELIGVIQGWQLKEYLSHIDALKEQGLIKKYMGIGSVCRRHSTSEILKILYAIRKELPSTNLHGLGVKLTLLEHEITYRCLDSIDSMAWSFSAFKNQNGERLLDVPCQLHDWKRCIHDSDDCANCGRYMNNWLNKNLKLIKKRGKQAFLPELMNNELETVRYSEDDEVV